MRSVFKHSTRKLLLAFIVAVSFFYWGMVFIQHPDALAARTKGIKVTIKDRFGRQVGMYKDSYALVIGASKYTEGWPKLESVPGEIESVEVALKKHGFKVTKIMNPTSRQLKASFEDFINKYGYEKQNRLLFFYSGHGYTRANNKKG